MNRQSIVLRSILLIIASTIGIALLMGERPQSNTHSPTVTAAFNLPTAVSTENTAPEEKFPAVRLAWFTNIPRENDIFKVVQWFDLYIFHHFEEDERDLMIARGARGPILQYLLFESIQDPGSCTDKPDANQVAYRPGDFCQISEQHPDWFLLDTKGQRIPVQDGDNDLYLMDPGNPGWRSFYLDRIKEIQSDPNWNGVFLDNVPVTLTFREKSGHLPAAYPGQAVEGLPSQVRIGLVRGDCGFGDTSVQEACEAMGMKFIFVARLTQKVQWLCRHEEAAWHPTEIPGLAVQEVELKPSGRPLVVVRQRIAERPQAGGKTLFDLEGYRFQALVTNLPPSTTALAVWRRYNGRADLENRIKELGDQFGIKRLCVQNFWGTEAMHHLAITAYNLCVLLQRRLGQLEKCQLNTLRWRLFSGAAVWSRTEGKPTLRLAVRGQLERQWWREIL